MSSSAYARIVLKERRRYSSWMSEDLPTNEAKDIVTCILTLEKFCKGEKQEVKVGLITLLQLAPAGQCCNYKV